MAEYSGAVRTEAWGARGDDWVILLQDRPRNEMVMPRSELLRAAAAHMDRDVVARVLHDASGCRDAICEPSAWGLYRRQADALLIYLAGVAS